MGNTVQLDATRIHPHIHTHTHIYVRVFKSGRIALTEGGQIYLTF